MDSPYYVEMTPYSTLYKGFYYEEQQKYKHFNTKSIISIDCADKYPSEDIRLKQRIHLMKIIQEYENLMVDKPGEVIGEYKAYS